MAFTIQHKRKTSAVNGGQLGAGEIAVDTSAKALYFSTDGTDALPLFAEAGVTELFVPAGEMVPRVTAGASATTRNFSTNNIPIDIWEFADTSEQGVGFWVNLGDLWDAGTVKFRIFWTTETGGSGGDVDWSVSARSYSDDDNIDQALGTAVVQTDVWLAHDDLHITEASGALTVAGATNSKPTYFEITRPNTDTLAANVQLVGISIQYDENLAWQGGTRQFTIPAQSFISRPTNGATLSAASEFGVNNIAYQSYKFLDSAASGIGTWIHLGNGWNGGTLRFKIHWFNHGAAIGDVLWKIKARAYADDDNIDQTLGTAVTVTDTSHALDDMQITAATSALTLQGSPAAGQPIYLEVERDPADPADTATDDQIYLLAVTVEYTNVNGEPAAW